MGLIGFFFPWGVILQGLALVHFIRRRPDNIWLWVIIFLGPLGALLYIGMEVAPDLSLLRQSFDSFGRKKRIRHLEALVLENPAPGNYEELAELLPETYFNYATFLASQGRTDEARSWAQRIVALRDSMPIYLRRRERPWFKKAKALLKRLPNQGPRPKA